MTQLPLADNGGGCACCSGPSTTVSHTNVSDITTSESPVSENTKESPVSTQTFSVTGMTCGHCVSAVTSELKEISGVTEVSVDLVAGGTSSVTVDSDQPVDEAAVAAALDEAGEYQLASS